MEGNSIAIPISDSNKLQIPTTNTHNCLTLLNFLQLRSSSPLSWNSMRPLWSTLWAMHWGKCMPKHLVQSSLTKKKKSFRTLAILRVSWPFWDGDFNVTWPLFKGYISDLQGMGDFWRVTGITGITWFGRLLKQTVKLQGLGSNSKSLNLYGFQEGVSRGPDP